MFPANMGAQRSLNVVSEADCIISHGSRSMSGQYNSVKVFLSTKPKLAIQGKTSLLVYEYFSNIWRKQLHDLGSLLHGICLPSLLCCFSFDTDLGPLTSLDRRLMMQHILMLWLPICFCFSCSLLFAKLYIHLNEYI